jgi:acetyl esterase/lipase
MRSQEVQQVIEMLRSRPVPETPPTLAEMRSGMEQMFVSAVDPAIQSAAVTAGGVPGEWVSVPSADEGRVVLYLHGGGYVLGSPTTHRDLAGRLARAAGARSLLIDYRLAPEHPFPAAVEDAVAAYQWLLGQGTSPSAIAVAGDSAGGGLTAATLVAIRDRGLPAPAAAVLISPWTDLALSGDSMTSRKTIDPMIAGAEGVAFMRDAYLAGADAKTPLASPLYADLAGLPPLLIQVGTDEVLFDDSIRFDARARAAGVDVTLEPGNGLFHVWHLFAAMLPEARTAIDRAGQFVRQHARALATA